MAKPEKDIPIVWNEMLEAIKHVQRALRKFGRIVIVAMTLPARVTSALCTIQSARGHWPEDRTATCPGQTA